MAAIDWQNGLTLVGSLMLAAALLVYPAMVLSKYVRIMMNVLDGLAPTPDLGQVDKSLLGGEEVRFGAADGHPLGGVILAASANVVRRGMIVFSHEVGNDRTSCLRYAGPLREAGYDVFAFDFRGHGTSPPQAGYLPRQWASDRERDDMLGAIRFIGDHLEKHGRSRDVALLGISRGAGAAILASVGMPCVKAIITDGAFSSDTTLEYLMRRFATTFARIRVVAENHPPPFWRFLRWLLFVQYYRRDRCRFPSVRKAVVRMGAKPILLIHGEKDSYIPIAQSQRLFDLAEGPKEIWSVPDAKHNQSIRMHADAYTRHVVRFLREHLPGSVKRTVLRRSAPVDPVECPLAPVPVYAGVAVDVRLSPAEP